MILDLFRLEGKSAVVCGGGRGIGRAIALAFAESGADVVVSSRTAAEVEAVAAEVRGLGKKGVAVTCDARVGAQVFAVIDRAVTEFGKIDIMVNNAGGMFFSPTLDLSERGWDAIIQENLKSAFIGCQAAGRVMLGQKKGCIINMGSFSGLGAYPGGAHYGAAKAAIISLTRTLAVELAPYVRVNCIAPTTVLTEGVEKLFLANPGFRERRLSMIPLRRLGLPRDVAAAAVYLASDAADYVTGEVLPLRGGLPTAVG